MGYSIGNGAIWSDPDEIYAYHHGFSLTENRRTVMVSAMCAKLRFTDCTVDRYTSEKASVLRSKGAVSAFDTLKTSLSVAPVLHSPDCSKPLVVQCNESQYGIEVMLLQNAKNSDENYVVSKKLNQAAVGVVRKFLDYRAGTTSEVVTDHALRKRLMSQ